jgi:hypothetical protein
MHVFADELADDPRRDTMAAKILAFIRRASRSPLPSSPFVRFRIRQLLIHRARAILPARPRVIRFSHLRGFPTRSGGCQPHRRENVAVLRSSASMAYVEQPG